MAYILLHMMIQARTQKISWIPSSPSANLFPDPIKSSHQILFVLPLKCLSNLSILLDLQSCYLSLIFKIYHLGNCQSLPTLFSALNYFPHSSNPQYIQCDFPKHTDLPLQPFDGSPFPIKFNTLSTTHKAVSWLFLPLPALFLLPHPHQPWPITCRFLNMLYTDS